MRIKPIHSRRVNVAFTLIELLVVICVMVILMALTISAAAKAKDRSRKISCTCNLKQTGLAFRIFGNDNGDAYPMSVSTNKGGSMGYVGTGEVFSFFRAMSNELSTPKILLCPADTRKPALSFSMLSNANISYFVGLDAANVFPQTLLAGDRNLMTNGVPVGNGVLVLTTNLAVGWTAALHKGSANVLLGDGSVRPITNVRLQQHVADSGVATNRLVIP